MNTSKSVYLTTAIPYVNGQPHAGHALDYLLADVYKRYLEQTGATVRLQAGTDEHGNKIWRKAQEQQLPVEEYIAQNAQKFRDFIAQLGVEPTDFIRTSDPDHQRRCQAIWRQLEPHIYSATYEGWYCSGCERFITDSEYAETNGLCPDHNAPYERLSEENFYFRIADFKAPIRQAIESDQLRILPEFRKHELLRLLDASPDVSISRPRKNLSWGITVPDHPDQVIYVWLDALVNYITVLGYPDQDISAFWPAQVQFIGKDILRFHAIIWPAILLGLGLPLPHILLTHGFITSNGQKMSKSIGNVIDPLEVLAKHGCDPFRYFFLRHIDTFADSDFTWDKFESAYANELANDLGNLVQRLATLCHKNSLVLNQETLVNAQAAARTDTEYAQLMEQFDFNKAFDYAWTKLQALNKAIDEQKPWALAKSDPAAAQQVLTELSAQLLTAAELLRPFLPTSANQICTIFSAQPIVPPTPLFPKQ